MEFSKEIRKLFIEAGWHPGRNIKGNFALAIEGYPGFVTDFLNEYANLKINCMDVEYSTVVERIEINPEFGKEEYEEDGFYTYFASLLEKKLFPIAFLSPDSYYICCDAEGNVFMLSEYCYYRGKNLQEGFENIMRSDWSDSLALAEDAVKWRNRSGEYVSLP
jgi:hypothetical protein